VYDLTKVNFEALPEYFYSFYCLFLALGFSLIFFQALTIFVLIPVNHLAAKLLSLWLVIAELSTLIDFVLRKYFLFIHHAPFQKTVTLAVFSICCLFFFHRAIFRRKSDDFYPEKTYIVRYTPKNIPGLINHIVTRSGHTGIYQDGFVYKFRKMSGTVEEVRFKMEDNMTFEEIKRIKDPFSLVGKEYRPFSYNCNTMVKDALQHSTR
jgi:hypothetical protein